MISYLWAGMICLAILTAALTGKIEVIAPSLFNSAEQGGGSIGLISIMTFWLGIMKLMRLPG